jgi:hypothetical protein
VDARTDALQLVVTLARQHGLTPEEIAAALNADDAGGGHQTRARRIISRVLGYLGGTFVFAGVGVFIALQWDSMGPAARIVITLGSGVAACALALVANADARYEKAATPLFLVAGGLEPTGMLVAFGELGSGSDWRWASLATCATMALQFGAIFVSLRQSVLLFLCVSFAVLGAWSALDLLRVDGGVIALVLGATLLLASAGVDRTPWRGVTGIWYLLGGGAALAGLFDLVERTPLELAFLAAASGLVYVSAIVQSRALLAVSVAGILAYTGWFTSEHFADSIGWPLALVVFGLAMIALSALAVRIDRDYVRPR